MYPVDRNLDHLTYSMRYVGFELIARCAERKVPIIVLETLRLGARQDWLFENGKSWTRQSLHEASKVDHLSRAMDAAPIKIYDVNVIKAIQWDSTHRTWQVYVEEAEKLGLECGALWSTPDWSHVQLPINR